MKFDSLLSKIDSEYKTKHLFDTLSLASRITTQRSYKSLIKSIRELLPQYFGFEQVGILLLDTKTNNLFTVSDDDGQPDQNNEFTEADTTITFPTNLGISGTVFHDKNIYVCNNAWHDHKYTPDIDNLSAATDVYNFMIGPIFDDVHEQPVGIIQLVNKNDKKFINDMDREKFKIIEELLGMSVFNTSQIHELINVTIGLKQNLNSISNLAMDSAFEFNLNFNTRISKS